MKAQVIRVLNTYRFAHVSEIGQILRNATTERQTEGVAAKENDFLEISYLQGPVQPSRTLLHPRCLDF